LFQGFNEISKIYGIDSSWECYCFEPNPKTYISSKENYLKLLDDGLNIIHFNAGVSNKNDYVNLNLSESTIWDGTEVGTFTGQSSNILLNPPQKLQENPIKYNSETEIVRVLDFSNIIETFSSINDFIVVKLDVEGSEFDIIDKLISSGTIKYINEIYIEFHPHFFDDLVVYRNKIENYKKVFSENRIKFTEWY
jgi:FkbM family methyltransferase